MYSLNIVPRAIVCSSGPSPRNLLSSPLCKTSSEQFTRRLDGEVVKLCSEKPRCRTFQPSTFATSHSFDERDVLIDNGELQSFTELLSRAGPVAAQVASQVVDLTMDSCQIKQRL